MRRLNELVSVKAYHRTQALVKDDQSVNDYIGQWVVSAWAFLDL